ncbi:MAG: hypothetical protein ACRDGQ_00965 [Candidatus Limnocylindrales bacterium]
METRSVERRELVLMAVVVIGLSRLLDGPLSWLVAALLAGSVVFGALAFLGQGRAGTIPVESTILPALAALASLGAIRVVPDGLPILVAVALAGLLLDRTLALERHLQRRISPPSADDRTLVLSVAVLVAFLAFVGSAALVQGGLVEPAGPAVGAGTTGTAALSEPALVVLALVEAFVAGLLGFRLAVLRERNRRAAVWSAITYAAVVAISAGAIRAVALPRLLGPAIVTLVFFLWDGIHGSAPTQRRDPRWIWQTALLGALGLIVIAWNMALR